jgi:hypothetical protein
MTARTTGSVPSEFLSQRRRPGNLFATPPNAASDRVKKVKKKAPTGGASGVHRWLFGLVVIPRPEGHPVPLPFIVPIPALSPATMAAASPSPILLACLSGRGGGTDSGGKRGHAHGGRE